MVFIIREREKKEKGKKRVIILHPAHMEKRLESWKSCVSLALVLRKHHYDMVVGRLTYSHDPTKSWLHQRHNNWTHQQKKFWPIKLLMWPYIRLRRFIGWIRILYFGCLQLNCSIIQAARVAACRLTYLFHAIPILVGIEISYY